MPKLWNDTIDAHKRNVRDSTLDATADLVTRKGLAAVTMSEIAQETGIGRATLYKYFPDVEAVLLAWHERQVHRHLESFRAIASGKGSPLVRLRNVLDAYGLMAHDHEGGGLASALHRGGHVVHARDHLTAFLSAIITEAVAAGEVREDVPAKELAVFCLSAVAGAAELRSKQAVERLVSVALAALRPL
nr:TetR/AcrR family transcriptional regulator [uncultured Devosia sp.]